MTTPRPVARPASGPTGSIAYLPPASDDIEAWGHQLRTSLSASRVMSALSTEIIEAEDRVRAARVRLARFKREHSAELKPPPALDSEVGDEHHFGLDQARRRVLTRPRETQIKSASRDVVNYSRLAIESADRRLRRLLHHRALTEELRDIESLVDYEEWCLAQLLVFRADAHSVIVAAGEDVKAAEQRIRAVRRANG